MSKYYNLLHRISSNGKFTNRNFKILETIKRLETPVLESFLDEVSLILARRKSVSLSKKESTLMDKINNGVSIQVRERQKELSLKNRYENLIAKEKQELLQISQQIEEADILRLTSLIELAQTREVSVDTLMNEFGLKSYE